MTRGTIVYIDDVNIYVYPELNGDMYPSGQGGMLLEAYTKGELTSKEEMDKLYSKMEYGYGKLHRISSTIVDDPKTYEITYSDWVYFVNNTCNVIRLSYDGRRLRVKPNCLTAYEWGKLRKTLYVKTNEKMDISTHSWD